jgi:hypothetical protein
MALCVVVGAEFGGSLVKAGVRGEDAAAAFALVADDTTLGELVCCKWCQQFCMLSGGVAYHLGDMRMGVWMLSSLDHFVWAPQWIC